MQSYQRRSQNRDFLRESQCRINYQGSNDSRNRSKKKFLEVCSKKGTQLDRSKTDHNLRSSTVSLPINFDEARSMSLNHHGLNRSQANLHTRSNILMVNNQDQGRGHSLPTKTIIIREIIHQVPVNFSMLQPQSVRINTENNGRQSFPMNMRQIPHKNDVIRIDQLKQAAAPIRIFSNAPINHYQLKREPLQIHRPPQVTFHNQPPSFQPQVYPVSAIPWQSRNPKPYVEVKQRPIQTKQMLSNKSYIECDVKLEQVQMNIEQQLIRKSRVQEKAKSNYNSLVVTQQDEQGSFKQNLQIKTKDCICEKIRNFTECSEIKIKQVLKPKKNFIFV